MLLSPETRKKCKEEYEELRNLISAIGIEWFPSQSVADAAYARLKQLEYMLALDDKVLKEMQEEEIDKMREAGEMEVEL